MNNTFNLHRFGLLLKRQWLEFGKIFLITLLVVLGVFIAFYGYNLLPVSDSLGYNVLNFREPLFMVFGFLFISIIASTYFAHLGQKSRAVIDLMIPASVFEKFLAGVCFTGILASLSFIILFYLTDLAFVSYVKGHLHDMGATTDSATYFFTRNNPNQFKPLYLAPFFITSVFLLGSVYFNRFHYIKTAISVMVFSGIWTYIIVKATKALLSGKVPIHENANNGKETAEFWVFIGLSVLTLIIWSITYVRLKEKEV
ncbi:hypothetical protein VRU48_13830 [Pedobacter sp. KR3-3]|uniref:ABC transporter permease n=1 Tax=Pedobacter albus TaxID=3113905 RepID=A0ABU7I9P2_9SPHI|nr:hypothetical protein [Pedobacter sp. KR3-3]MEE1946198.1 hypothetical protein [Pedobacter sp. KR3-3]